MDPRQVRTAADALKIVKQRGLSHVKVTAGTRRQRDPFTVLIASGSRPATIKKAH